MNPRPRARAALLLAVPCAAMAIASAAPPAWQDGIRRERLSSGVALALDGAVPVPRPRAARPAGGPAPVPLDPRVGGNIVLGPDPSSLPAGFRAQAEPHVARHPRDPDVLLAAFQDGRFTDGGAVTCGYGVSRDGGLTWTRAIIPRATTLDGGKPDRATDPVAAFSPDGSTWYLNTLGIEGANLEIGVLQLSRSTDGGRTFGPPVTIYRSPDGSVFPDKNWMTVNTFAGTPTYGRIVVTFTRFQGAASPIAVTYSDDDGLTWSAPVLVTASGAQCQGSQPLFLPDGRLVVLYWDFFGSGSFDQSLRLVTSGDGGKTFGPPATAVPGITSYDDPNIRDGVFLPSAAVDPATGTIWTAYQGQVSGVARILVARSSDGGVTWSAPRAVSDNPARASVFNPSLAVTPDGRGVMVAFWDNRAGTDAFHLDTWVAQSLDGGTNWLPNLRVTSVSADTRLAPLTSRGYMIGDYFGFVAPADALSAAVALTIDTRDGDPQPMAARFAAAAGPSFDTWRVARFGHARLVDPATGGDASDADGDGTGLLAEYGLGMDPTVADAPALRLEKAAGALRLTVPANPVAADVRVDAQSSADLKAWSAVPGTEVTPGASSSRTTLDPAGVGAFLRARVTRR